MIKKKITAKKSTPKASGPVSKPVKKAPVKATPKTIIKKVASQKSVAEKFTKPAVKAAPKAETKKPISKVAPTITEVKKSSLKGKVAAVPVESRGVLRQTFVKQPSKKKKQNLTPFFEKQRVRLLMLKDTLLDSMKGVARDNLHAGSEASGFGMHQADAGSDAYDRDFALSILSQEQNSLYEIDEALKRIDDGTYGVCEISNKQILRARLEARPFTRYTVECQAELEKRQHVVGTRLAVSALFGLTEEESENDDDENLLETTKD